MYAQIKKGPLIFSGLMYSMGLALGLIMIAMGFRIFQTILIGNSGELLFDLVMLLGGMSIAPLCAIGSWANFHEAFRGKRYDI